MFLQGGAVNPVKPASQDQGPGGCTLAVMNISSSSQQMLREAIDETENDEEIEVRKHLKPTPKPLGITSSWGARRYQAIFKRLDQRSIDTN